MSIDDEFEDDLRHILSGLSSNARAAAAIVAILGILTDDGAVADEPVKRVLGLSDAEWTAVRTELEERGTIYPESDVLQCDLTDLLAARSVGAPGRPSDKQWRRLRRVIAAQYGGEDQFFCVYCFDVEGPFVLDHVRPVALGGSNHPKNLAPCCQRCNTLKGSLPWHKWWRVLERIRGGEG